MTYRGIPGRSALDAALTGLIVNSLGINQDPGVEELKIISFWMFAAFVPLAILGNIMAWRFEGCQGRSD